MPSPTRGEDPAGPSISDGHAAVPSAPTAPGRRERKRLETRAKLTHAALELFAERGFDAVTVLDISDRADVAPSTFFRHFGSKEAVLFSDYDLYLERVRAALETRPPDEPILVALRETMAELVVELLVDVDDERLRVALSEAAPSVRAEGLVRKERLIDELASAIAEHLGVDRTDDSTPDLLAHLWIEAANWHRAKMLTTGAQAPSATESVALIDRRIRALLPVLQDEPAGRRTK